MNGFVGITDNDWFAFLSQQPGIDEVNLWQPSGTAQFRALAPQETSRGQAGCYTRGGTPVHDWRAGCGKTARPVL